MRYLIISRAAIAAIMAAALLGAATGAAHALRAPSPRVCFPARHWAPAPDSVRPCARILRVYEDGSLRLGVYDADGTVRYTFGVGNLAD